MIRTLTTSIVTELQAAIVRPILLVDMTFADHTYHFWTGVGLLTFNSNQYIGTAQLAKIEGISETDKTEATGVSITVEGIDSTYIMEARSELLFSGKANIYLGFLDPYGNVISSPIVCFSGFIDNSDIEFGTKTGSVKFNIENRMAQLNRSRGGRMTDADQHMRYPNDNSLRWCSYNSDRSIIWK